VLLWDEEMATQGFEPLGEAFVREVVRPADVILRSAVERCPPFNEAPVPVDDRRDP